MTDSTYSELVRALPQPVTGQVDAFVDYTCSAHSWYKHLPLFPPGAAFAFYLDPDAGRDKIVTQHGVEFRDRTADTPEHERFHYTWQPTSAYLTRFGHLQYHQNASTAFRVELRGGILVTDSAPEVRAADGTVVAVPGSILDVATVGLTAAIHELGGPLMARELREAKGWFSTGKLVEGFVRYARRAGAHELNESGGERRLRKQCRSWIRQARRAESVFHCPPADWFDAAWVQVRRERERSDMRTAIGRMLDQVYRD